ncbi:AlpA family transcriptional regulator [Bifidobacterium sp. UTCIF-24]|uniref:helix-turn-helix transcriptional regulator n=1 Tax=Bifidobacterium sp. UTCIF-24 TaxID=1465256 RepID=UPI001C611B12|nr:hypothetical protein [Bifidobacterium sp. UTCIF-24]
MANIDEQVPYITDGDQWFTCRMAAAYVHSTVGSLSTMRSNHTGPKYYKPSKRRVLYRKSDLDAWLEGTASTREAKA